jgi:large subunit ribosomal protein L24
MQKIKVNDLVKVISGRDKGKQGKVLQIFPKENLVVVETVNKRYKHIKKQAGGSRPQGGERVEFSAPFSISNVKLICPKCNKPTRVGFRRLDDKTKVRVCKKCNEVIK